MFPSTALLSAVLLALSLSASTSPLPGGGISAASIPFLTKFAQTSGGFDIVGADGARIRAMLERGRQKSQGNAGRMDAALPATPSPDAGVPNDGTEIAPNSGTASAPSSFGVTNAAVVYTASVGIGMPATQYTLLIDTGSSNTWVGSGKKYAATSASKDTGRAVSVSYGSGSFTGREYLDRVTLSPNLVINQQSIGVANSSSGFESMDGVLGLGPTGMTAGTLDDGNNDDTVPTVTDSLFSQHTISTAVLAISFQPTTASSSAAGELTFGGTDPSKYTGQITYAPLTKSSPASCYWGIEQSVNYDGRPLLPATAGIVDTGTTLLYLASDAYAKYAKLTGATHDQQTGFLRITPAQYSGLKNLNFVVSGRTFALTPNAQIWPRAMNDYIGGAKDSVYLIVNDLGTASGSGLDFISGFGFLTRFYSVFDTSNKRVGLATTQYTNANTN